MRAISFKCETGFAMVESMVSVLLLSIGAIGIAVSTATAIKINADNQQRAMALSVASMALEPLYIAANADSGATLKSSITAYVPIGGASVGVTVASNPNDIRVCESNPGSQKCIMRDSYVVKVLQAVDSDGADVLTTAPPYASPVTLAVQVDYNGIGGRNINGVDEIKSVKTSYTLVLNSI